MLMLVMTLVHFAALELGWPGVLGWPGPGLLMYPVTGATLHGSVATHLAECFYLNAMIFCDPASSNVMRISVVIATSLSFVVLTIKIIMLWHLPCPGATRDRNSDECEDSKECKYTGLVASMKEDLPVQVDSPSILLSRTRSGMNGINHLDLSTAGQS